MEVDGSNVAMDEESRLPLVEKKPLSGEGVSGMARKNSKDAGGNAPLPTGKTKALAALFYAVSSLAVIFTNKIVLTSYGFPSFNMLAASQFVATSAIMLVLHYIGRVQVNRRAKKEEGLPENGCPLPLH